MTGDLQDRLRADMARFTRDVRVPPGLALRAYRHHHKRRTRLRIAIAAGTTAALAAGAVTAAGVTGALVTTAGPPVQTAAYVIEQVDSALSPAMLAGLIAVTRVAYPAGTRIEPLAKHFVARPPEVSLGPAWDVAVTWNWHYQGTEKESAYGPDGQRVFDATYTTRADSEAETAVLYNRGTWWTASWPTPVLKLPPNIRRWLAQRTAGGWPAQIRQDLATGLYKLVGRQVVDGIDTVQLTTGGRYPDTLWVNAVTFLPVRDLDQGTQTDYQWLAPTKANLARLGLPVPAGFKQVPPNM